MLPAVAAYMYYMVADCCVMVVMDARSKRTIVPMYANIYASMVPINKKRLYDSVKAHTKNWHTRMTYLQYKKSY